MINEKVIKYFQGKTETDIKTTLKNAYLTTSFKRNQKATNKMFETWSENQGHNHDLGKNWIFLLLNIFFSSRHKHTCLPSILLYINHYFFTLATLLLIQIITQFLVGLKKGRNPFLRLSFVQNAQINFTQQGVRTFSNTAWWKLIEHRKLSPSPFSLFKIRKISGFNEAWLFWYDGNNMCCISLSSIYLKRLNSSKKWKNDKKYVHCYGTIVPEN